MPLLQCSEYISGVPSVPEVHKYISSLQWMGVCIADFKEICEVRIFTGGSSVLRSTAVV